VTQVTWHSKGDYFSTLSPDAYNDGIVIHQLSKVQSQKPFKKSEKMKGKKLKIKKGIKIQRVLFHPSKPLFLIFSKIKVKIYNLVLQKLVKKLKGRSKWISSSSIHPTGDHIILGYYLF
jgi:ribosome biogenesis protein ERB1